MKLGTIIISLLILVPNTSNGVKPYAELLNKPVAKLYIAPGKMFAVHKPSKWSVIKKKQDPHVIEFHPNDTKARVFIQVKRMRVPSGASPMQLALNAKDYRLAKLPLYQHTSTRKVVVAGRPAVVNTGSYRFQGNQQYPISIEEVYVVHADEAFIIHFECFTPLSNKYLKAIETFYTSFIPRPKSSQLRSPPKKRISTDVPY